jgi:hypothetical protein
VVHKADKDKNKTTDIATLDTDAITENQNALSNIEAAFSDHEREIAFLIGERTGKRKMAAMIQKLLTVTDLIDLQKIKESKIYKGFRHFDADGKPVTIQTFQEYCTAVEGRSYEAINLELNNLRDLGPQLFDAMRQVGIGPGTMREIRQLPDDQKALLEQASALEDKNDIVELIDALTTKHVTEKEALKQKVEELTADAEAKDRVVADKSERMDKLETELAKTKKRIASIAPDAIDAELREEATDYAFAAEAAIRGQLREALSSVLIHANSHGINVEPFLAGLLGQVDDAIAELRTELGIERSVGDGEEWEQRQTQG